MVMSAGGRSDNEVQPRHGRLRIKHLQLIEALGRTGTIGQAADELRITQSAASKTLHDAEQIFDAALFDRHARGLGPTTVGSHVIRYARRCLNETGRVLSDVETLKAGGA